MARIFVAVYQILNTVTNHRYVGSSRRTFERKFRHFNDLRLEIHGNAHLQNAYNKYGKDAFMFSILEPVSDINALLDREQFWIDTLKPEYNIAHIAGSCAGVIRSEETRKKLSLAGKGRMVSDSARARISAARTGTKASDETRAKLSAALRGRTMSQSTRDKLSAALTGRKFRPETIERMRQSQKLRGGPSPEAIEKAKLTKSKNKKPDQPCCICEKISGVLRKGRCHACNEYFRRNGTERPPKRDASVCPNGHKREDGKIGCRICNRDATRRYRERAARKKS